MSEHELKHESDAELIKHKKEKINSFLKDKYNLGLIGVIVLAIIIRFYYFLITKDQAHWWDTLAYGDLAKNMVYHLWDNNSFIIQETVIRGVLLPLVWSFFIRFNFSEYAILILLEVIPSVLCVYFMFLIGKLLYNKQTGLVAAFLLSISWLHLFYTARIMTDIPAMLFSIASIYFFILAYKKDIPLKEFSIAIFLLSLAVLTRNVSGLIGVAYLVFLAINFKHKFLYNKNFWIGGIIGVIPLLLFFASNLVIYGNVFPAVSIYAASTEDKPGNAYYIITQFFPHIFQLYLLILVALGTIMVIAETVIGYDLIRKSQTLKSHLLLGIIALLFLVFYIFILKAAEDRYLLVPMISLLLFASYFLIKAYDYSSKGYKTLAVISLIIILALVTFSQISYGGAVIESKVPSYAQMKEAFLWIKDNTSKDAKILGDGIVPYVIYYSERESVEWNDTDMEKSLLEADYVVLHAFENQDPATLTFVNSKIESEELMAVQGFFFDQKLQQPAVIIYKVNK